MFRTPIETANKSSTHVPFLSARKSYFLAFLSGLAAALGHAPFGLWPVAILGFVLLIWLVSHHPSPFRTAWAGGVGYFATTMHWIVEPFLVDIATHGWIAPFALVLLAGGLALFWGAAGWLACRYLTTPRRRALGFAALLTVADLTRGYIFTGFPWGLPAYIWADTPLRAATAFTGSYGLTFLTLIAAALPLATARRWVGATFGVLLVAGLYGLGSWHIATNTHDRGVLGQVRLVQPNVPQHEKWVPELVTDHLNRLRDLSQGAVGAGNAMVVWPEAAIVFPLHRAKTLLSSGFPFAGVPMITGINRQSAIGGWHNSMVVIDPDGTVQDAYDKVHLVPFGEYIPFKLELIRAMAASAGFGFTPGEAVHLIDTPLGRALPLICYEGIFPRQLFRAEARADYLLMITNDAWFGTFSGPYQHLDQARFRAAEQGLSMVRVANTGISAVIDPLGAIDPGASMPLGVQGALDLPVPKALKTTIYAQSGNLPLVVILLTTFAALILAERRNAIAKGRTTS